MPGQSYVVILDPPSLLPERTELNLNTASIQVMGGEGKGIDWGEAQIKAFMAEQRYGEVPTDYRVPNRIVQIPLVLGARQRGTTAEAASAQESLQQKVGLFQKEGGALMRERAGGGQKLFCDIVNASLTVPDIWAASSLNTRRALAG